MIDRSRHSLSPSPLGGEGWGEGVRLPKPFSGCEHPHPTLSLRERAFTARAIMVGASLFLLAACGGKNELRPQAGKELPPKPLAAATPPSPSQLMTPEVQARPQRSDELLKQSQARRDDRFDLPPQ